MTEINLEKNGYKPLIITGKLAQNIVRESVLKSKIKCKVLSLPSQVAALMSANYIAKSLASKDLDGANVIIIPGMTFGDAKTISDLTGVLAYKGPKFAADLPTILDNLNEVKLSTSIPACELMKGRLRESILAELSNIKKMDEVKINNGLAIPIGSGSKKVWIGRGIKPCILAEIVDAPKLSDIAIRLIAKYFSDSGADIIDIGMVSEKSNPEEIKRIIKIVRNEVNIPVSIDTSDLDEIETAVEEGVDLILSINAHNMDGVSEFALDIPVVVTPVDEKGICPKHYQDRINQLESNFNRAKSLGFKSIIADPILNPPFSPNFSDSINAYSEFARRNPSVPIFFGLGNVIELLDCDSLGVNLLFTSFGLELGISIILATEASDKTRGCINEISIASDMAVLSKNRMGPPKDLGLNLLRLKEKIRIEELYDREIESNLEVIEASKGIKTTSDPMGFFKIMIDRKEKKIVAIHYKKSEGNPNIIIKGKDPKDIFQSIIERNLISKMEHACYISTELSKAGVALNIDRSYVQDSPLFNKNY